MDEIISDLFSDIVRLLYGSDEFEDDYLNDVCVFRS